MEGPVSVSEQTREAVRTHVVAITSLAIGLIGIVIGVATSNGFDAMLAAGDGTHGSDLAAGLTVGTLAGFGVASAILAVVDIRLHLLPHVVMVPAACWVVGGMMSVWLGGGRGDAVSRALVSGLVGGLLFLAIAMLPGGGLGGGDVKLAALIAAVLGWFGVVPVAVGFIIALTSAGAVALALIVTRRAKRNTHIAFGPFLLLGAWAAIALVPWL